MRLSRRARQWLQPRRAPKSAERSDEEIIREYELGCMWASRVLCGMFAFMSLGAVFLGW